MLFIPPTRSPLKVTRYNLKPSSSIKMLPPIPKVKKD